METHSLLTTNLEIDSGLEGFLKNGDWSTSKDYVAVSIIGAQGTGKSTLLNAMFGSSFKEKLKNKNKRTTVGADISIFENSEGKYYILIDSEGIGCLERQKDCKNQKIEHSVFDARLTSFILSAVDVLLINIYVNQIGQVAGSLSTLVKEILEINRKFIPLKDNRRKTIIYVVRDFSDKQHDEETLMADINSCIYNEETDQETGFTNIEEAKILDEFNERYDIKFIFMPNYLSVSWSLDFNTKLKDLKRIILDHFGAFQNELTIGDLLYDYQENLTTIIKNYKCSAEKMIQKCLEIENFSREECDKIETIINNYSSLKQMYEERDHIIEESSRIYRERIEADFQELDAFNQGINNIINKAYSWFKTKAKILYDKEVDNLRKLPYNELKNIPQLEINEKEYSSSKINKIFEFRKNQITEFYIFIDEMKDDWFDLNWYKDSKSQELTIIIEGLQLNYDTLIEIVNEMKFNIKICLEKYINDIFRDEDIIFSL